MDIAIVVQLGIVLSGFLTLYLAAKWLAYLKRKNTNTELWATVFEGLTQNAIPQEPLKEPKTFIEKKAKRNGQDNDPFNIKQAQSNKNTT